jgi:hypothetical protein
MEERMDSLIAASAAAVQLFICMRSYLYLLLAISVSNSQSKGKYMAISIHITDPFTSLGTVILGVREINIFHPHTYVVIVGVVRNIVKRSLSLV